MTNCNILEELGECIKSAKPSCRFSQKQLMTYFLGEKLEEEIRKQKKQNYSHAKEMEENGLGERFLRMLYKGERQTLAPARLIKLATSEDWTLERLTDNEPLFIKEEKEHLEKCIRELYFRHLPDANGNLELGDMVCSLVRLHFFGTEAIEDLLIPYNPQKFTPCMHYIPWDEKEEELQRLLEQEPNFPVFITGLPASGKKQMVKHYISSNFNGTDIFWLDHYPDLSLEEQLSNIQFLCEETDKPSNTEKIIQFLQYKTSSSLLIITISLMESDDCRLIEQYLGDIDLKIIIITRKSYHVIYRRSTGKYWIRFSSSPAPYPKQALLIIFQSFPRRFIGSCRSQIFYPFSDILRHTESFGKHHTKAIIFIFCISTSFQQRPPPGRVLPAAKS